MLWTVKRHAAIALAALALAATGSAHATYWNVFNIEGESAQGAQFVTYADRADMLLDSNRLSVFTPGGAGRENIVDSASNGSTYWSLFNIEGESAQGAQFATYAKLSDMLLDTARLGVFSPGGAGNQNIVGTGSDGINYWNLFNIEGESAQGAQFVTYATLADMLLDTARLAVFSAGGAGNQNIVGTGSDGSTYWNLFNIEGESAQGAQFVTYATLADMLLDTGRLSVFSPGGAGNQNIVSTGSDVVVGGPGGGNVPEPATLGLVALAFAAAGATRARRRPG